MSRDSEALEWVGTEKDRGGSSRGPRWGGAVSWAEAECGRHKGVKDEDGDTIKD